MPQNPFQISRIVSGDAQLRAIPQSFGKPVDDRCRDYPALVMPRFGPGVREQDEGPVAGSDGQAIDKLARAL